MKKYNVSRISTLLTTISLLFCQAAISADAKIQTQTLDELLKKVLLERSLQSQELRAREKAFLNKQTSQKRLLLKAKNELVILERRTAVLTKKFEENEKILSKIEEKLNLIVGTLGELFGVVRQVAGDFRGQTQGSIISAHVTDRDAFLGKIAETKSLPKTPELERLWFEIQREMTESGKVIAFNHPVILANGKQVTQRVTRIGTFNLISDGKYFNYQSETKQVTELPRQPSGRLLSLVEDFEDTGDSVSPLAIDPSRGTILSALVQAPTLSERIDQGGTVGYIILILLFIGLVLSIERVIVLRKESHKLKEQMLAKAPLEDNVLGEIMTAFDKYHNHDLETLELKIDEVVLRNTPRITRGVGTIKILSAIAPLLGLLGTVTGMIATFQSITLFGTGDPKLMAGGISQALVTTVLGLVCAIPLLLLYNLVSSKCQGIMQVLEEQSIGMIASRSQKDGKTS